jgi:hypothetical protein
VLGSDQTLELDDGAMLSKPESRAEALDQLHALSGGPISSIPPRWSRKAAKAIWWHSETVELTMRRLGAAFLEDYLDREYEYVRWSVGGYRIDCSRHRQSFLHPRQLFELMGVPYRVIGSHFALIHSGWGSCRLAPYAAPKDLLVRRRDRDCGERGVCLDSCTSDGAVNTLARMPSDRFGRCSAPEVPLVRCLRRFEVEVALFNRNRKRECRARRLRYHPLTDPMPASGLIVNARRNAGLSGPSGQSDGRLVTRHRPGLFAGGNGVDQSSACARPSRG